VEPPDSNFGAPTDGLINKRLEGAGESRQGFMKDSSCSRDLISAGAAEIKGFILKLCILIN
jgi:hypothetical protein